MVHHDPFALWAEYKQPATPYRLVSGLNGAFRGPQAIGRDAKVLHEVGQVGPILSSMKCLS